MPIVISKPSTLQSKFISKSVKNSITFLNDIMVFDTENEAKYFIESRGFFALSPKPFSNFNEF